MRVRLFRSRRGIGCRLTISVLVLLCELLPNARGTAVWIDTDPSIGLPFREVDDAFALVLALHSPEIRIAGVSTTYGNASLNDTTRIAQDLVTRFARNKFDVHAGAKSRRDLGRSTEATQALATALLKEHLTYIALGPLTNLATFLRLHPNLAQQIDQIVLVGGQTSGAPLRVGPHRWLTIHDANILKDSAAVTEVMKSECPITLAPIETGTQLQITAVDLQIARHTAAGEFLDRRSRLWSWFWRRVVGFEGGPLFDALPILAVVRPDLVSSEKRYCALSNNGRLIAKKTWYAGGRPVRAYWALTPRTRQWIRDRLQ